ncbi:MAG: hypothetical protein MR510_05510 [Clostridium sp.]|uniref:hypothetical protein n=1 Tax=Clostridium sp. TaxID=1506 RepID=UPI002A8417D2|nr:hypothetical protein [Clostridium sp.]MCI6691925.1 hypothetical protein [Clostridium sp.]MDY4254034.1 hypothetical protein [Clostridium sp.]
MKKDILDKLEVKNNENLSEDKFKRNIVLDMNKDLDRLKLNDDVTNEDIINYQYTSKNTNSY